MSFKKVNFVYKYVLSLGKELKNIGIALLYYYEAFSKAELKKIIINFCLKKNKNYIL